MSTTLSILMLVTGANQTLNGKPTGIWLEEFTVPYLLFAEAGYKITVASPKGGKVQIDPGSMTDGIPGEWKEAASCLDGTAQAGTLIAEDFDAIFLPGGHGTMFDLPNNAEVNRLITEFEAQGKVIAAVCHGPAGFVGVKKADGTSLVAGKRVTSFTDAEEAAAGMVEEMPFLLETKLREEGAEFVPAELWASHIEVDGTLVTGQNPASSGPAAEAVINLLQ